MLPKTKEVREVSRKGGKRGGEETKRRRRKISSRVGKLFLFAKLRQ